MNHRMLVMLAAGFVWVGGTVSAGRVQEHESPWIELVGADELGAWKKPHGQWQKAGDAQLDPKNPRRLIATPGRGVIVNGPTGKTANLFTTRDFGDVEAHFEFLIPQGSNSGVKLEGLYEIQIFDSHAKKTLDGSDCGGIYPKAEMLPRYHHTDQGVPPRVNAAKPAGEWQTLDIVFRAPRFDSQGNKTRDARLERVVLNDKVIHENVAVKYPTGHYYRLKERARAPIMLQADHGPVAFRKIRVRELGSSKP